MRSKLPALLAIGSSLAALAVAAPARADASGWMFVGTGALAWKQGSGIVGTDRYVEALAANAIMTIDVGAGTSPDHPFIIGTLARIQPVFGAGTDLALMMRACNRGFQVGAFGFALDAGAYFRTWGTHSWGFTGGLNIAAPLGVTLGLQAQVGTNNALGFGAVAGIDVLRLTVFRRTLLNRWPNLSPDTRRQQSAGGGNETETGTGTSVRF